MPRLRSLDVFRGITIAAMILVNNPGSWSHIYWPLAHASWHGWTPTDAVFPFFLWISGLAMTLSFARRRAEGANRGLLLLHTARRAAFILGLGLLLNLLANPNWDSVRLPGVLQRIGICYFFATLISLYTGRRGMVVASGLLLSLYGLAVQFLPFPGSLPDRWSREANLARYVDGQVLAGHMWSQSKVWDPEGLLSTVPAIVSVLLGILAGGLLERRDVRGFLQWGLALVGAAYALSPWIPFNKSLWTPSFTLLMAGLASVFFGIVFWLVEGERWRRGTGFFAIYGTNAIVSFVASGMLARFLSAFPVGNQSLGRAAYGALLGLFADPRFASLAYALLNVIAMFGLVWLLHRRKILVRL